MLERQAKLSDINFPFHSNLLERIFHLTTEMSLRQIHIYLGMKHSHSLSQLMTLRGRKIIDFKWKQILNVKCLMFLIKKATRCETEMKITKYLKAFAIIFVLMVMVMGRV